MLSLLVRDYSSTPTSGGKIRRAGGEPPTPAIPSPFSLLLEVGPLNAARGSGEHCKLLQQDLGRNFGPKI